MRKHLLRITCYLKMRKHLIVILRFWFLLQLALILPKILILGIHLFWKLKMANNIKNGFINIMNVTNASTDSSSLSKEIDIWDLEEIKNMNWSTLAEDTWLIWKIISNTRSTIHPNKDRLFFCMKNSKMPNLKDQQAQTDLVLIIFI